tara:strand:+ start:10 stop:372 length:363 start_codon:yes stop_codon:yes gene_type:complete
MSTHAALGVKHPDGSITGCYVHYDGATMKPRIEDFIQMKTTTGLFAIITEAQGSGGIRSFHCRAFDHSMREIDGSFETEFLDDNETYVINEKNWHDDHMGTYAWYLVDYETGDINVRSKY